ncbi:MAG: TraB/GumN family protein [Gammaproteobacteria bacterium]
MVRTIITALLLLVATTVDASGLAWRVTAPDGAHLYLVGTVHAARPDFYPLPIRITDAFEAADALTMEVNTTLIDPGAAARFGREHGTLSGGRTLEELLGNEDWRRASEWGRKLGIPQRRLSMMRPWLAAVSLVSLEIRRIGLDSALGMEMHFAARAVERGMPIVELETLVEQLSALSNLSPEAEVAFLKQSLTTADEFAASVNDIVDSWLAGDADAMKRVLEDSYEGADEVYDAVMRARNQRWLPAIERMIESEEVHFVAVGALHMVGEDGLVRLLEARGYNVERL